MKGYIYKYEFPDGKCYIGQTRKSIEQRHREHINESTGSVNTKLWSHLKEYGDNYTLSVLSEIERSDINELVDRLNYLERTYIEDYDSVNNGLNVKLGGGAHSNNDEIIDLYRKREIERRLSENKVFTRIVPSIESKLEAYLSESSNHGIYFTKEEYDLFMSEVLASDRGEWVNHDTYEIIADRDRLDFYLEYDGIHYALTFNIIGEIENEVDYYISEHYDKILEESHLNRRTIIPIEMYSLDNTDEVIQTFYNTWEVNEYFNKEHAYDNVYNVCKGKQNSAYGYGFRWVLEQGNH